MVETTMRRRRLAHRLRRLREAKGMSLDQVAAELDMTKSTLSRMEKGQVGIRTFTARMLAELYGADSEELTIIKQLAKEAREKAWWQGFKDVLTTEHADYLELEAEAKTIRNYECAFVPGLLQTEAYARALIEGMLSSPSTEAVDRRIAVRTARQKRWEERPELQLWAILDEAVLRRPTGGPSVMSEQLLHLAAISKRPNVTLQVLPNDIGAHPGMSGAFSILQLTEDFHPDVVYVDTVAGELYMEDAADVDRCSVMYDHLRAAAMNVEATRRLLRELASALAGEKGTSPDEH